MRNTSQTTTALLRNSNSRKQFPPKVVSTVQADWLQCRNARDCARRHGISPRTIHNWIKKYHWADEAEKVDTRAKEVVLERATRERVSLLERVQRVNDEILSRLEETRPAPTLADFREGVKLEESLTGNCVLKSNETEDNIGFRKLVEYNASLSEEQQLERLKELTSRMEDVIDCKKIRDRLERYNGHTLL